ncbi:MAG TPA: LPS export ABC transporter permease LptF [Candidatus Binataceae bacterium]|nr:LPS export ABC transporter permease LptF [Candidatus Binataceae bacterium]
MPRITILDRYVAREVLAPFGMGVAVLTFALVTGKLLKLIDMVVNHGVSVGEVLGLIAYIMPAFFELTFPMAVLLGVLLGFGRMSGDREMIAARACGVSLYRIAIPVMMIAFVVYLVSSWFAFSVRPWANRSLEAQLFYLTRTRVASVIRDKVFNDGFRGLVVYVDRVSPGGSTLQGVMIADGRTPDQQNTIISRRGILIPDERHNDLTLRLFDGSVFGTDPKTSASHITNFKTYDLNIKPEESFGSTWLAADEMSYQTLLAAIHDGRASGKRNLEAETELARKYMIPIATLLFAMLGVSLGLKPARGGQSERFGVSVALFFAYYTLMRAGQTFAERGSLNPFVAMSIPDLVFAALAIWLFIRSAEDRGNEGRGPGDIIWDLIERYERSRQAA